MVVTGPAVQIGTLAPGATFLIGTDVYFLLGTGFTASSGGVPIVRLSDGAMGPNVNSATPVVPLPYKAVPV